MINNCTVYFFLFSPANFVHVCKRSDPQLEKCLIQTIESLRPELPKGKSSEKRNLYRGIPMVLQLFFSPPESFFETSFFPLCRYTQNASPGIGTDAHSHVGGEQKRGSSESQSHY